MFLLTESLAGLPSRFSEKAIPAKIKPKKKELKTGCAKCGGIFPSMDAFEQHLPKCKNEIHSQ